MTDFTVHTIETAPEASRPFLNLFRIYSAAMAESPALVEGCKTPSEIFNKTDLSETERQIILMTNNRLNGCTYCMAAHSTGSKWFNVPDDVIGALRTNTTIADPKLEALCTFAGIVNETRGWPTQEQVDTFLATGYTKQTVLEVVLGTSLKVMSNYTNHISKPELDEAFSPNAWTPDMAKAA